MNNNIQYLQTQYTKKLTIEFIIIPSKLSQVIQAVYIVIFSHNKKT